MAASQTPYASHMHLPQARQHHGATKGTRHAMCTTRSSRPAVDGMDTMVLGLGHGCRRHDKRARLVFLL